MKTPGGDAARRVSRLALSKTEAAEALGVSVDFLEDHVLAELPVVRRGRKVLIPAAALDAWLATNAARTLPELD